MTIYLFGDSYVENEPAKNLNMKDHKRWYDLLGENCNEDIINYGICGTGQIFSMDIFLDMYEKRWFEEDDKFVIVLSSPYRIPWKWPGAKDYGDATIYQSFFADNIEDEEVPFTENQKYLLNQFYKTFHDELARNTIKNIYLLKSISEQNNWKMVVFTVYPMNMNPYKKRYNEKVYNLTNINTETFYYYKTPLFLHSCKEWISMQEMDEALINHFSERNHTIISNIITNHFLKTNYSTVFYEKFIKKIINEPQKLKDFIYD